MQDSPLRNLAVFALDPATGVLAFRNMGPIYQSGEHGGPITVVFNAAGTKLAATTFGVADAADPEVDLTLQKSGRLYLYNFAGGAFTQTGMYEEEGIAGSTGASWSPNGRYVYLTNSTLHSSKEDNSVTVHDGTTAVKVQNFATADRNDAVCWTLISQDRTKLYIASFTQNVVSTFDIGADDRVSKSLTPNFFARRGDIPAGETKEMYEAGGYLYVQGTLYTHSVSIFKTSASGALAEVAISPYHVPSAVGKTDLQQAFLGLTGFEK